LFKEQDAEARPAAEGDILDEMPLSVLTGRTLEEIAADRDRVWKSNRAVSTSRAKRFAKRIKTSVSKDGAQAMLASVTGKKRAKMPARIEVQLATHVKEPPEGDLWLHEIKFDGYRMICRIEKGRAKLLTRKHKDWTERFSFV